MRARTIALLAAALAGGALAACGQGGGPGPGEARLEVEGTARVTRLHGTSQLVTHATTLHSGDVVEAVRGAIHLQLHNGTELEGRARRGATAPSRLRIATTPELLAGPVLIDGDRGASITAAGTKVRLLAAKGSAARVTRTLAVSVGTYAGTATIDSAGQERTVRALRAMDIPAVGRPPARPRPLVRDSDTDRLDPWDLRYLGDEIVLGRELASLSRGYTQDLPVGEVHDAAFFRGVLAPLQRQVAFADSILENRPAGETLIGAAITDLGHRGDFAERWRSVFAFRDQGAIWGLVAADQGVARDPLLNAVEQALNRSPSLQFASAALAASGPSGATPTTVGGVPSGVPSATGSVTTAPPATLPGTQTTLPGTPTTPTLPPTTLLPPILPPLPPPTLPPLPPLVDQLTTPVTDLLGNLIGQPHP